MTDIKPLHTANAFPPSPVNIQATTSFSMSAEPKVNPPASLTKEFTEEQSNKESYVEEISDLVMVVTNETMEETDCKMVTDELSRANLEVKLDNDADGAAAGDVSSETSQHSNEAKASNDGVSAECASKDVSKATTTEEVKEGEKEKTTEGSNNRRNTSGVAHPVLHHSYHYHHNNGYSQYPHHPGQWNPQWNHRHPHPPPQSQHHQAGPYHPYYSRYPYNQRNHVKNGAPPPQQSSTKSQQHQSNASVTNVVPKEDKTEDRKETAIPASNSWASQQQSHPYPHPYSHWRGNYYNYNYYGNWRNIHWSSTNNSVSTAEANKHIKSEKEKKRARDGRCEVDTERDLDRSYTDDTASTLSVEGLSMAGVEQPEVSSPKRRKGIIRNQNIHRDRRTETPQDFPQLDNTSTLSDGKMILENLSVNSLVGLRQSYSSEIAELCGSSPINVDEKLKSRRGEDAVDLGKTPKKRNTSSKKLKESSVFRLENPPSTTPAAMRLACQDDDSPTMLDLIGVSDTPLTNVLLSSMEHVLLDETLNKQLRGQTFTPLPQILGGDDVWSFNGSPLGSSFEKLTPRFGLDSTKSKQNSLASPRSFWKDDFLEEHNRKKSSCKKDSSGEQEGVHSILSMLSPAMREMEPVDSGLVCGPTSPIPIHRKNSENISKFSADSIATPLHKPPAQVASALQHHPRPHHDSPWRADHRVPSAIMHSPIPSQHHSHHPPPHMSPYDGRYGKHRRDAPYGMYPPPHHGHYNPEDRIRNLRGRCPPVHHHMPPSHHLPPPSYHHFSPLTNVPRGRNWHENQHNHIDSTGMSTSKRKCVPLRPPVPAKFQGDIDRYKDVQVPEFNNLVNFPCHMNQKQAPNVPEGLRCCVMCGQACPCSQNGKLKRGDKMAALAPLGNNKNISNGNPGSGFAIIPTQNKGLCTLCDVNVWIVTQTGLEIKWCKGCKNFRPWAAFGDKGLATKCVRCRDRQREKYALQKEEKERQRGVSKSRASAPSLPPISICHH